MRRRVFKLAIFLLVSAVVNVAVAWACCTLPLLPIWHGFAINTGFYDTIMWLLVFAPFVGAVILLSFVDWIQRRRAIRWRRGRCPQCAYDLRDNLSAGCPECGWRREDSDERKG